MGSSGGGSSGQVEWPAYMQAVHSQWLDKGGSVTINQSVTDTMNAAFGNSPFSSYITKVVDSTFGSPTHTLWEAFELNKNIDVNQLHSAILNTLVLSSIKQNLLAATQELLDEDIETQILPRLKSGARDVNVVQSSSYIFAAAYIESSKQRQLAKLSADIDYKLLDTASSILATTIDWNKTLVVHSTEIGRLFLAGRLDELKFNAETDAKDKLWDLRVWEYGAHVMSSISGGTAPTGGEESSQVQNVLGGAMSGAAAGAQIGNAAGGYGGYGAVIGAVAGGVAGAFS